ncbi:MAG TPA: hypothetical protein VFW11_15445 [Cyclobacteriaceae bacterium]|nr:hypothetical protein [Cyclobacteriaceae bacterium]
MKLLKRILLVAVSSVLLLVVAVLLQDVDPEQKRPGVETFEFADTLGGRDYNLDSLKAIIGDNKGLPEGFEVAAAIAYSAFPELKDVKIDMLLTMDGAPMESTPDIWSLFGARKNRQYHVLLNDAENSYFDPILLRALPFDAQVGILAHELGHIAYYQQLNLLQFGKWGLMYLTDDTFRAKHERSTDLAPLYHGLGSQIYQYAYYVRYDPSCQPFYAAGKSFMDKYYMTDEELLEIVRK